MVAAGWVAWVVWEDSAEWVDLEQEQQELHREQKERLHPQSHSRTSLLPVQRAVRHRGLARLRPEQPALLVLEPVLLVPAPIPLRTPSPAYSDKAARILLGKGRTPSQLLELEVSLERIHLASIRRCLVEVGLVRLLHRGIHGRLRRSMGLNWDS